MLGSFLEISVQTKDILASLDFYMRLGFERAPVNDVWTHPYAVVSDGHVYLGLHQYDFPSPSLTFVQPDLRQQLSAFEALGVQFEFCKLGEDQFNEAGFYDPNGQMVALLEARTCSPVNANVSRAMCGYFDEYRLAVRNLRTSSVFWEQLGLINCGEDTDTSQSRAVRLATGGLNLGLQESTVSGRPQVFFRHHRPEDLVEQLVKRSVAFGNAVIGQTAGISLTAPEGTRLMIIGGDS
jgi:hypothetical protein